MRWSPPARAGRGLITAKGRAFERKRSRLFPFARRRQTVGAGDTFVGAAPLAVALALAAEIAPREAVTSAAAGPAPPRRRGQGTQAGMPRPADNSRRDVGFLRWPLEVAK